MDKELIKEWKEHECSKHLLEVLEEHMKYVDSVLLSGKLLFENKGTEQLARALGRRDLIHTILSDQVFELNVKEDEGEKHE